jgi:hypothetical protein
VHTLALLILVEQIQIDDMAQAPCPEKATK